ncbi:hypothetical protein J7T55_000188 [Diaporthe amygdali]|uniref:uncharacterized protein n=1 Tax=Phomopsis amygdali TaxID=1214568 RepID=UPI0022FDF8C5|nr:uncharacterized protein J7T55_000188 [Diaporthe amygdali]KAJ0108223.1 hypothetical protein J7T55_000188 [Diaporthe amygdali]
MDTQSLNWTLISEMAAALTQEQRDAAEWRIANTGKISMQNFKTAIGFLFALASLAFIGRIFIRVWSRHRILLDDGVLIISFASLVASTSIFYKRARIIYLVFSLMRNDQVVSLIASQEIADVYDQMNWSFAYMTFLWTTIFMVKFCYFAFFHTLLLSMPRVLIRYYWTAVVATAVAWIYMILQQLITCPYFGSSSSKCFPNLPVSNAVLNFTFWTGPVLDALTDVAIISIPILVLQKSQMALLTKIGFGVFLCLSLFMLACSITRAAGTYYRDTLDVPWQVFWLHAEACIGVLMASVTVYRAVLVGPTKGASRSFRRFVDKVMQMRSSESERCSEPQQRTMPARFGWFLLSKIPNATLTGLATLLGDPDHKTQTANNMSTMHSTLGMEEIDYHEHLKQSQSMETPQTTDEAAHSRELRIETMRRKCHSVALVVSLDFSFAPFSLRLLSRSYSIEVSAQAAQRLGKLNTILIQSKQI